MNLKNYTSTMPVEVSIAKIEKILVRIGAKNINKEYVDGGIVGIKFLIDVKGNTVAFSLPAKVNAIFNEMWRQRTQRSEKQKKGVIAQAEMTAWKIVCDWVEIQASMIYLEQADVMQIFFPYAMINPSQTFYEKFIDNGGFKQLQAHE